MAAVVSHAHHVGGGSAVRSHVDLPAALMAALDRLTASTGVGPELIVLSMQDLGRELGAMVSEFRGVRIRLVEQGQPVVFTATHAVDPATDIATSLELGLGVGEGRADVTVWTYAAVLGAWVDLAADLNHALHPPITAIRLDTDLPTSLTAGVVGLDELGLINIALGILITEGCSVETALEQLTHRAGARRMSVLGYATLLASGP